MFATLRPFDSTLHPPTETAIDAADPVGRRQAWLQQRRAIAAHPRAPMLMRILASEVCNGEQQRVSIVNELKSLRELEREFAQQQMMAATSQEEPAAASPALSAIRKSIADRRHALYRIGMDTESMESVIKTRVEGGKPGRVTVGDSSMKRPRVDQDDASVAATAQERESRRRKHIENAVALGLCKPRTVAQPETFTIHLVQSD